MCFVYPEPIISRTSKTTCETGRTTRKDTKNKGRKKMKRNHKTRIEISAFPHFHCLFTFCCLYAILGEVIYTTATTKPSAMPTNSLLRSSLSVNSRHHQRTTSGMTSSSSATSSNSNNVNNERHRDNSSRNGELQKTSGGNAFSDSRDDDSQDGHLNPLHHQNGKIPYHIIWTEKKGLHVKGCVFAVDEIIFETMFMKKMDAEDYILR